MAIFSFEVQPEALASGCDVIPWPINQPSTYGWNGRSSSAMVQLQSWGGELHWSWFWLVCLGKMKNNHIALIRNDKEIKKSGHSAILLQVCWHFHWKHVNLTKQQHDLLGKTKWIIQFHSNPPHLSVIVCNGVVGIPCCPSHPMGITCHQRPWSTEGAWRTPKTWGRFSSAGRELTTLIDKRWTLLKCWNWVREMIT